MEPRRSDFACCEEIGKVVNGKRREIDIAFVFRDCLFVLDCKAKAKDFAYIRGEHNKIRNRQTHFREELEETIPERVELIRQGKATHKIHPDDFKKVNGMICTTAVEYLPREEGVFWQGDHVLVGTPEEILATILAVQN